jgi:hypothetical protein
MKSEEIGYSPEISNSKTSFLMRLFSCLHCFCHFFSCDVDDNEVIIVDDSSEDTTHDEIKYYSL